MEKQAQRRTIEQRCRHRMGGKCIVCLDIADRYGFMERALVELLLARVPKHLPTRSTC